MAFFEKHHFHPLFIMQGSPDRFLASVGLAQAHAPMKEDGSGFHLMYSFSLAALTEG